jgi:hypothetical protein
MAELVLPKRKLIAHGSIDYRRLRIGRNKHN